MNQQPGSELVEGDLFCRPEEAEKDLSVPLGPSEGEGCVLQMEIPREIPLVYVRAIVSLVIHVQCPQEPKIQCIYYDIFLLQYLWKSENA